jgi:hypothetical protein
MKKYTLALILGLSFGFGLIADDNKPVIQFMPFTSQGISSEEARFIESLIQSYITDIGDISYLDSSVSAFSSSDSEDGPYLMAMDYIRPPDYILSGSINTDQDNRVLALEIQNSRTGETSLYIAVHKTTSELALKTRSLVETVFNLLPEEAEILHETVPEPVTEAKLLGTWRGDTGIELVRLQRGGNGLAIFSSGAQMALSYTVEGHNVRIVQTSPNTEFFYHPLPFTAARKLAANAEPMTWVFSLYDNGTALRGIRSGSSVRSEGNTVVEFIPHTVWEAEWIKSSR